MNNTYFITDNSEETLGRLKDNGFYVCPCCKFYGVKWISLYTERRDGLSMSAHGVGYQCENECKGARSETCIMCHVKDAIKYGRNVHIFSSVEDFLMQTDLHERKDITENSQKED